MSVIDEHDAILKPVQLYIDGALKNDIGLVKQAFHANARLFGSMSAGPQPWDYDMDMPAFFEAMASEPMNGKGTYRARVLSTSQFGCAGVVVLAEEGCWGDVAFIDILSLWRQDGVWKIVNKTFMQPLPV